MRCWAMVAVCVGVCAGAAAEAISTASLLDEMIDMHRLTRYPSPAFKTVQYSSYDRSSLVPGGPTWFANSDGFGEEPQPNFEQVIKPAEGDRPGEYLICDVEGPGAIVRLWTAQISGNVRMFLDGRKDPVYDGSAQEFFLHPYNAFLEGSGLTPEVLDGTLCQNTGAYAPIPFEKRCRIVWIGDPKETHFYQVQVRRYEKGANVEGFSPEDVKENAERIRRVASVLADTDANWPYHSTKAPVAVSAKVPAGERVEALKLDGPGAAERLVLKVTAADLTAALRQTILHIRCDGWPWGQVQAPVGDFFGAGPGVNPYSSVPFSVAPDGTMTCRYVMPYESSIQILFENRGGQEVTVEGSVLPADYAWDESSMHFRGRWRIDHDLMGSGEPEMGAQDLPFVVGRGRGVYVGTAVMLMNTSNVPTPWGNWWGEGDEKVFVDDDVRPSTYGTGSEDYFNYAWSDPALFDHPYCGQPRDDGPANRGFVVNYRWHILDPLPFEEGLSFYMELFTHHPAPGMSYGRIAYHYARPGFRDDHVALTAEDVRVPRLPETWEPVALDGVANTVFHAVEDLVADKGVYPTEEDGLWQGGRVLVWTPAQAGETLKLSIPVEADGKHNLHLACMLRGDGGSFRASLDGQTVKFDGKEAVSLAAPHRLMSRMFGVGNLDLKAGTHELTLTAVDAGKPIGLDFVGVQKH